MMLGKPIRREFDVLLDSRYFLGLPATWDDMKGSLRIINVVTHVLQNGIAKYIITKEERHA